MAGFAAVWGMLLKVTLVKNDAVNGKNLHHFGWLKPYKS